MGTPEVIESTALRLGDILVQRGLLTEHQLAEGLEYQRQTGARIGEALEKLGFVSEEQVADALACQANLSVCGLGELFPNPSALHLLTEKFCRTRQVLPLEYRGGALVLAMANPTDVITIDDVRMITGLEVIPTVTTEAALNETLDYIFSDKGRLEVVSESDEGEEGQERLMAETQTVVSLVDEILDTALKRRASDVHFEPMENKLIVRARVDGVLHQLTEISTEQRAAVTSRVKILGDMDIAEKRLPQDGRATYRSDNRVVDLRIASIPTVYGENITIRLLDDTMFKISLEDLGMGERELGVFRDGFRRPYGELLITGPTGSGKSTTLYAALEELNNPAVKIYTVEDPVERKIPGVLQSQIKAGIGLTFARALRSLVRSDPDIIMIGEIRDHETALIATEASLTGHLVLSTLHTNDAPTAITRLMEMGIPPYLIASALECVVAQRLARRLCPRCKNRVTLHPESMSEEELELFGPLSITVGVAVGCPRCFGSGYSGRIGLFEVLQVTPEIRRLVLDHATADDIRDVARSQGMTTLRDDGLRKVLAQSTTIEEVKRVTA